MAASNSQSGIENQSGHAAKNIPKDAIVMAAILKEMGVSQYEPRVINQMLEFSYRYVTDVLEDARVYSLHADKKTIDLEDVQLAVESRLDHSFTRPPPREFLLDIARKKNSQPLPLIADKSGVRLPPDRYCLTANNYKLKPAATHPRKVSAALPKSLITKLQSNKGAKAPVHAPHISSVDQKLSLPLQPAEAKKMVAAKTVQSNSQTTAPRPTTSNKPTKATMSTSTISNLPSMEETTASASAQHQEFPNLLKRKREDDDEDYDV